MEKYDRASGFYPYSAEFPEATVPNPEAEELLNLFAKLTDNDVQGVIEAKVTLRGEPWALSKGEGHASWSRSYLANMMNAGSNEPKEDFVLWLSELIEKTNNMENN